MMKMRARVCLCVLSIYDNRTGMCASGRLHRHFLSQCLLQQGRQLIGQAAVAGADEPSFRILQYSP